MESKLWDSHWPLCMHHRGLTPSDLRAGVLTVSSLQVRKLRLKFYQWGSLDLAIVCDWIISKRDLSSHSSEEWRWPGPHRGAQREGMDLELGLQALISMGPGDVKPRLDLNNLPPVPCFQHCHAGCGARTCFFKVPTKHSISSPGPVFSKIW